VVPLARSGDQWVAHLSEIPAGTDRVFTLSALDVEGVEIYRGQATGVAVVADQTVAVAIGGQQVTPPPSPDSSAPVIDSLIASSVSAAPGDSVTLMVTAHDDDEGDTLSYSWTATGGTLSAPTAATTGWLALPTAGTYRITVTVSDSTGAAESMWVEVTVVPGSGGVTISVDMNQWPALGSLSASHARLDLGESSPLSATASDVDGDELSYSWSAECDGTFSPEDVANPTFTLGELPESGTCRLTVTVTDGRGGAADGSLTINTGPVPPLNVAPQIMSASQAPNSVSPGGTVILRVQAVDPEGGAITFAWAAATGELGTPVSDATSSQVVWTAPAGFAEETTIVVDVTEAGGVSTRVTYQVGPVSE
jgi:hypothetical protein